MARDNERSGEKQTSGLTRREAMLQLLRPWAAWLRERRARACG